MVTNAFTEKNIDIGMETQSSVGTILFDWHGEVGKNLGLGFQALLEKGYFGICPGYLSFFFGMCGVGNNVICYMCQAWIPEKLL